MNESSDLKTFRKNNDTSITLLICNKETIKKLT